MKSDQIASRARILNDRDAILRELEEIVSSAHFCNSKRYPAMLEYLVKSTLAGKENLLKERTIGIEVFDRPSTYDTSTDTVVRFTASEVRKRLSSYYHDQGHKSGIRISLPSGSYVPEFFYQPDPEQEVPGADNGLPEVLHSPEPLVPLNAHALEEVAVLASPQPASRRIWWLAMAAVIALAAVAGVAWERRPVSPLAATDAFWRSFLHGQKQVLVCTGTTTVSSDDPDHLLDVAASNEISQYPLVPLQTASAISLVDYLIEGRGVLAPLLPAATTPLSDLRENAVVLLTAYTNPWTMRFVEPLRFHFASAPDSAIVDRDQPQVRWAHNPDSPYANTDDYALIARFWNRDTDNWMVVLAGVGRNGTEAAAQFVVSPKQMRRLRDYLGRDFSRGNLEVVLKVNVIDGKTGAPTIIAANLW